MTSAGLLANASCRTVKKKKKMTAAVFAVTAVFSETRLDRHKGSPCTQTAWVCGGNVSALITHLFWEGGREKKKKKKQLKMKSEKVTSAPWLKVTVLYVFSLKRIAVSALYSFLKNPPNIFV